MGRIWYQFDWIDSTIKKTKKSKQKSLTKSNFSAWKQQQQNGQQQQQQQQQQQNPY